MEIQIKTVRKDAADVLDLDNSTQIGGGSVGDVYCEATATEHQTFTPWTRVVASGLELLRDPRYNKGTAISEEEPERHYLRRLLPAGGMSQELQIKRILQNVRSYEADLEKYVKVMDLQECNERLFYKVLIDHVEELLPIVGEACQKYGNIFRRPHGLYITLNDRGHLLDCIVVTDGDRIRGLGDLGLQGKHIFVSGSPFKLVTHEGKTYTIGQSNNCYIFWGVGLGCVISGAIGVHDDMLLAAAESLASQIGEDRLEKRQLFPVFSKIRDIGAAVAEKACDLGLKKTERKKRTVTVAVTGAGGFIASWIVKLLLQRGFFVRGTLRNIDDENTAHLRSLEGASERLELLKADILHPPSLVALVEGCDGVFHTACPVLSAISDPEAEMLRPAVEGTLNVLRACAQAQVKRVVMTSSIGAVYMNPSTSPDQVIDENCWSDEKYLKDCKEWYCLAKLMAERTAWDYARAHNLNMVTVCPAVTLGTMLQPRINQSSIHILKYLNGSTQTYANLCQAYVDVEDAAEAHVLAFVTPSAGGRFLCCKWTRHRSEIVSALACMYPHYPIPRRCKEESQPKKLPLCFSSQKVEKLGLQFTSFDQTLKRTVSSLQAKGILQKTTASLNMDCDHTSSIQASQCTSGSDNNNTRL